MVLTNSPTCLAIHHSLQMATVSLNNQWKRHSARSWHSKSKSWGNRVNPATDSTSNRHSLGKKQVEVWSMSRTETNTLKLALGIFWESKHLKKCEGSWERGRQVFLEPVPCWYTLCPGESYADSLRAVVTLKRSLTIGNTNQKENAEEGLCTQGAMTSLSTARPTTVRLHTAPGASQPSGLYTFVPPQPCGMGYLGDCLTWRKRRREGTNNC